MRLKIAEGKMEGAKGCKPIPLPRRTNKNLLHSTGGPDSDCRGNESLNSMSTPSPSEMGGEPKPPSRVNISNNNNITICPGSTGASSSGSIVGTKPIPLPRKLYQRLTTSSSSFLEKRKSNSSANSSGSGSNSPSNSNSASASPNFENEPVSEEVKRGTINIFKRTMDNPFDNDFEKSIKEAELLRTYSFNSPLMELDEATRARFSTSSSVSAATSRSSGSEDYEHYMEPKSTKRVSLTGGNSHLEGKEGKRKDLTYENVELQESRKRVLEKVVSCPPSTSNDRHSSLSSITEGKTDLNRLAVSGNESLYETISTYSSSTSNSDSNSNFGLDPFMPINPNGSQLNIPISKRITVPNVDKSANVLPFDISHFDINDFDGKRGDVKGNFQNAPGDRFSFSDGPFSKHSSVISEGGESNSSSSENKDKVVEKNGSSVVIRRNVSNRSTSTSESRTSSTTIVTGPQRNSVTTKKVHEYDEVAVEDGAIVFKEHSNFNSIETVTTNNNSCSSLTSRNSVVQEFDPLFEPEKKTSPIDLLEDPLHRYEYIDVDTEEEFTGTQRDSVSGSGSVDFQLNLHNTGSGYVNPEYFPVAKKEDGPVSGIFLEQNQSGHVNLALSCSDSRKNSAESPSEFDDQEYEPVRGSNDKMEDWKSGEGKAVQKDMLNDVFVAGDSSSESTDSNQQSNSSSNGNSVPTSAPLKTHTSDLVNQSNFFRRLSKKIGLNVIKEEKELKGTDGDSSSQSPGPPCRKCLEEHPENVKCKFVPAPRENIVFSSNLYKPAGISKKDFSKKWAVLSKGKLTFYNEKSEIGQELLLEKAAVISKKHDQRVNTNLPELKCFELGFCQNKPSNLVLAGVTEGERCSWMQKYIEAFTSSFPVQIISNYDRGGWCYIKESVTSNWHPSWLILKERTLYYANNNSDTHYEIDLRKTRSIALSQKDGEQKSPFVDNHEVLTLDLISKIIYVQTESAKITSCWEKQIHSAAILNGTQFHEMQLTMDNIPVIVDKCIDFLYAHGTLAEGIYRQSGSNTRITQLLADFQKDAWSVQISNKEFSAHDVAGTLKRFFRTLPEPLVTVKLYDEWSKAAVIVSKSAKLDAYTNLLDELPEINYNIMKKLICHLYAVHELHEKNLMPLINLAPIWGPTLMNVDTSKLAQSFEIACAECEVVKDLIENYYTLFRVDPQEIAREKKMQDALESFHLTSKRKCSGDMKMWIYIWEKDETTAINITLTPSSTAHTIVQQLCAKAQLRNHETLSLYEVICQKSLDRPLHPSEKVIETVLRWSIWDVEERKNNYLILMKNTLYPVLVQHAKEAKPVSGELKYADSKSKTFRKYAFQFSQAMLKYSKDSKASTEIASWKIEDIVWYMGCETKRTPPSRWTFTFVKRNYPFKRSKEEPFFGNVVSCSSEEELHVWIGAMVLGEHSQGLYPSVLV